MEASPQVNSQTIPNIRRSMI